MNDEKVKFPALVILCAIGLVLFYSILYGSDEPLGFLDSISK